MEKKLQRKIFFEKFERSIRLSKKNIENDQVISQYYLVEIAAFIELAYALDIITLEEWLILNKKNTNNFLGTNL